MKKYFLLILLLFCSRLFANNYYVSQNGFDSNAGTSPQFPWKSLLKVNTFAFLPGDSILFRCGEIWQGQLKPQSNHIVIATYGIGKKPLISGMSPIQNWSNKGGNTWEATPDFRLKNSVNIVTIDGRPYAAGRTPNSNYFVYQSATPTRLNAKDILATSSYVGAQVVIRKKSYRAEMALVTAQSGNTISYVPSGAVIDDGVALRSETGTPEYGFFFQRYPGSLDQFGEWYYDTVTQKLQLFSTRDPNKYTIEASFLDTIVDLGNRKGITLSGIEIKGGGLYGVYSKNGSNITVQNCTLTLHSRAIHGWNSANMRVENNRIDQSFCNAILIRNNYSRGISILNNIITNTGQLIGMGLFGSNYNLKGIGASTDTTTANNFVHIIGNQLINTGYSGIEFSGSNVTVRRNIVDSFCNTMDDGGGIYTFTNNQKVTTLHYTNRLVDSNFIMNAIGAPEGARGEIDVAGYYMDDQAANITGTHNSIFNIPGNGVQMNNPVNQVFTDNVVFNCSNLVNINKKPFSEIKNVVIRRNIFYQKKGSQNNFMHTFNNQVTPGDAAITRGFQNMADIDSNWISNLNPRGYKYYYSTTGKGYTFPENFTLNVWQSSYRQDRHSKPNPVSYKENQIMIEYNTGSSPKTVHFKGQSKIDPMGTVYQNSATIPPWSSVVLISKKP